MSHAALQLPSIPLPDMSEAPPSYDDVVAQGTGKFPIIRVGSAPSSLAVLGVADTAGLDNVGYEISGEETCGRTVAQVTVERPGEDSASQRSRSEAVEEDSGVRGADSSNGATQTADSAISSGHAGDSDSTQVEASAT